MIAALVLAAGAARRYGGPKQIVTHGGTPLVRRAAAAAVEVGCAPVLVVVGAHEAETRTALSGLEVRIVRNDEWREGIASSIRCGVEAAMREPGATGILLLLSDVPAIDAGVLRRVVDAASDGGAVRTTACAYAGTIGPPAVFPRSRFERLLELTGDRGAKSVLLDEPEIACVDWPAGSIDLDDPADRRGRDHGL